MRGTRCGAVLGLDVNGGLGRLIARRRRRQSFGVASSPTGGGLLRVQSLEAAAAVLYGSEQRPLIAPERFLQIEEAAVAAGLVVPGGLPGDRVRADGCGRFRGGVRGGGLLVETVLVDVGGGSGGRLRLRLVETTVVDEPAAGTWALVRVQARDAVLRVDRRRRVAVHRRHVTSRNYFRSDSPQIHQQQK